MVARGTEVSTPAFLTHPAVWVGASLALLQYRVRHPKRRQGRGGARRKQILLPLEPTKPGHPKVIHPDQMPGQVLLPVLLIQGLDAQPFVSLHVREVSVGDAHRQDREEKAVHPLFGLVDHLQRVGAKGHFVKDVYLGETAPISCMHVWLIQRVFFLYVLPFLGVERAPQPLALVARQAMPTGVYKHHGLLVHVARSKQGGHISHRALWNVHPHVHHIPTLLEMRLDDRLRETLVAAFNIANEKQAHSQQRNGCRHTCKVRVANHLPSRAMVGLQRSQRHRGMRQVQMDVALEGFALLAVTKLSIEQHVRRGTRQRAHAESQRRGLPWHERDVATGGSLPVHHGLVDDQAVARAPGFAPRSCGCIQEWLHRSKPCLHVPSVHTLPLLPLLLHHGLYHIPLPGVGAAFVVGAVLVLLRVHNSGGASLVSSRGGRGGRGP